MTQYFTILMIFNVIFSSFFPRRAALGDVLLRKRCNFLAKSKVQGAAYARLRKVVIAIVLSTDMGRHFQTIADFTARFGNTPLPADFAWDAESSDDAVVILSMVMKMADVGHLMASWPVHMKWVEGLTEEFFSQGDDEKRTDMPVSFLMDRDRPGVSSSQVGGGSLFSLSFSSLSIFSLFLPPSPSLSLVLALSRSLSHSPPRVVRTHVRVSPFSHNPPPSSLSLSPSFFLSIYPTRTRTHTLGTH